MKINKNLKTFKIDNKEIRKNEIIKDKQNKKVNEVRTELLVFVDQENNKYLKNCQVKLNDNYPRDIVKKYSQCITVSFNNPIIMSDINENMHVWKTQSVVWEFFQPENKAPTNIKDNMSNYFDKNNYNQSYSNNKSLNTKSTKSIPCLLFSKCMKEFGRDFIYHRKKNVIRDKLNKNLSSNKLAKRIHIDTDISFVEAFNNINTTINKSKSSGRYKAHKAFKFPNKNSFEELFLNSAEKEEKYIQKNYRKLQDLVKKLKNIETEDNFESTSNFSSTNAVFNLIPSKNESFYKNFRKNFNDELFNFIDIKKNEVRDSRNSYNDNNFYSSNSEKINTDDWDKKNNLNGVKCSEKAEILKNKNIKDKIKNCKEICVISPKNLKIKSTIHPKFLNENSNDFMKNKIPPSKNPFTVVKSDQKLKSTSLDDKNDANRKLAKNLFSARNFDDEFEENNKYYERALGINEKLNLFEEDNPEEEKEISFIDNEELLDEIYSNEYPIPTPVNKKSNQISYTYSSNKDTIEFLSDNEIENRNSNLSYLNEKTEIHIAFGANTSDNQIVKLIKCKTIGSKLNKYDSDISKNSLETSRFSLHSKNKSVKSDYTMSYISEITDEINEKIL